jgi:hypothetical protein
MKKDKIEYLFKKFILNECSEAEIDTLLVFLEKEKSSTAIPAVEEVLKSIEKIPEMKAQLADDLYHEILIKSKKQRVKRLRIKKNNFLKYVVAIVLFIGIGVSISVFEQKNGEKNNSQAITLVLGDGSVKEISENEKFEVADKNGTVVGQQSGNKLTYKKDVNSELSYNTLTIPFGKRFNLELSDGTKVTLNSGSSLKYPVNFSNEVNRNVFITGEAYFQVSKDKKHPFIVHTDQLNVQVLGTSFNVSTYEEDSFADVVLVEGSVEMYAKNWISNPKENTVLNPGVKGSFDKKNNTIKTQNVSTSIYTSWINGELVFRNMTFDNILKKMERHYNVSIVNKNKELGSEEFNARFGDEPIKKVLNYLKVTYKINYTIKDNNIIIE